MVQTIETCQGTVIALLVHAPSAVDVEKFELDVRFGLGVCHRRDRLEISAFVAMVIRKRSHVRNMDQ